MAEQPNVVGWYVPEDQSNGFIAPDAYATSDIICHLSATNGQAYATVAAGGQVELQWTIWPDSHHGPVIGKSFHTSGLICSLTFQTILRPAMATA